MSKPGSKPYKWVNTPKGHPQITKKGLMQEHRLVAEQIIGRILKPEEVVHHIDEDTLNNNIDNLMIFAKARDHNAFHGGAPTWSNDGLVWHSSSVIHPKVCEICNKIYIPQTKVERSRFCSKECQNKSQIKIQEHDIKEIQNILTINHGNVSKVARMFGVTPNCIINRLKRAGVPYHSKDYKNVS